MLISDRHLSIAQIHALKEVEMKVYNSSECIFYLEWYIFGIEHRTEIV